MYRLHYNLRRKGNKVVTGERSVYKRAKQLTEIESKWIKELLLFGYGISDWLFSPPL